MTEKTDNHINLLVTIDHKYLRPTITMLNSYKECHKNIYTDVYILHSSLSDADIEKTISASGSDYLKIHSIKVTEKWFSEIPVIDRLPAESFYRLLAFHYLPDTVDRCIYLDPDIFINNSLLELYNISLEDYYIAACSHLTGLHNKVNLFRLGMEKQERYINSGVMLMNIGLMRENYTVEKILSFTADHTHLLLMGDQDLINMLFDGRILLIDEKVYNLDERTLRKNKSIITDEYIKNNTAVIHYNGKYKPWLEGYRGCLNDYYPEVKEKGPVPKKRLKQQIRAFANIIFSQVNIKYVILVLRSIAAALAFIYVLLKGRANLIISNPELLTESIEKAGIWDEVIFVLLRTLQTMFKFIPAEMVEIASGYIWGVEKGTLYCLLGNIIGTAIILTIVPKKSGTFFRKIFPLENKKEFAIFKKEKSLYFNIFLFYLIPGLPKDIMVYVAGIMKVRKLPFIIVTSIARIPVLVLSVSCGTLAADKQYYAVIAIFTVISLIAVTIRVLYRRLKIE